MRPEHADDDANRAAYCRQDESLDYDGAGDALGRPADGSWIKNQRSLFVSRARPRTLRRKTINGCLSATFSASSRIFDLNGEVKTARTKQSSVNIVH
jgi:hypothetical protein